MAAFLARLRSALFTPAAPAAGRRLDLARFECGVCPRCRGLRAVSSLRCGACGSTRPVAADA